MDDLVKIKVIGVGGGGNNTVSRMVEGKATGGVEFVAINTDLKTLNKSAVKTKLAIGEKITKGHGAGANPEVGKKAAEESLEEISEIIQDADMVFITTGMGGGTGTGASPIVAKAAKSRGILTIGVVTKPFAFEGRKRMEQAEMGIATLSEYVDALIVIPNERLKMVSETRITLANAFDIADSVLSRGVQSIYELINNDGVINLDFADVTTIMSNAGLSHMGVGFGKGKDKADLAARMAMSSPLLETSIAGARGIIVNVTASNDIGLDEIDYACNLIIEEANPDANIIWGAAFDDSLDDEMKITVIATGFDASVKPSAEASKSRIVGSSKAAVKTDKPEEKAERPEEKEEDDLDTLLEFLKKKKKDNIFDR